MHAVVFQVDIKEGRVAGGAELERVITATKAAPGFVRGTWVSDGRTGISMVLVESEDAARDMAADSDIPPDAPVTFRSADIYEVVGES
jgi:hypothetical protein